MAATIDSLAIEISSNAGSAVEGIRALGEALGTIKNNSSAAGAIKNLKNLKEALAGFTVPTKELGKLNNIIGPLKGLSHIGNLSGLASAFKEINKLPATMGKVDVKSVEQFTARMKELATGIAPLRMELTAMADAFSRLPANIRKAAAAVKTFGNAQTSTSTGLKTGRVNLMAWFHNFHAIAATIRTVSGIVSGFMSSAIEWDGIQARFGRAFGDDAEEAYEYIQRLNEALDINVQQFMQYSSLYGSLLKGFGLGQEAVTPMATGLTELTYDIWAAYNDRYKTLESASEAVRSAITGEIEPIRNAGVSLTEASLQDFLDGVVLANETMQDYLDSIGMTTVKVSELSEAEKAQVRYVAMANAAMNQGIVGTYARETQTAEGAVRTLKQQLSSLAQAFGSLLIPTLSAVIPYISAVVELLYELAAAIANVFNIPFFAVDWGNSSSGFKEIADSAGEAEEAIGGAGGAAKKLKDYVMGFDELNIISPDSGGGGGGGGSSGSVGDILDELDIDTLWGDLLFKNVRTKVEEIKAKLEEWKPTIEAIGIALGALGIASLLGHLGQAVGLGESFLGVMNTIKKLAATAIVITLAFKIMTDKFSDFVSEDGDIWDLIEGVLVGSAATWVLKSMWGKGGLILGFGVTAVASLKTLIDEGGIDSVEDATVGLVGLASALGAVTTAAKTLTPILKNLSFRYIFAEFNGKSGISAVLTTVFPKLATMFSSLWTTVSKFFSGFSVGATGIAGIVGTIASYLIFIATHFEEIISAVELFFKKNIRPKLDVVSKAFENLKEAIEPLGELFDNLREKLAPLKEKISELFGNLDFQKIISGIGKVFEIGGGIIFGLVTGPFAGMLSSLATYFMGWGQILNGTLEIISSVDSAIKALFQGDWQTVLEEVQKTVQGIKTVLSGLYNVTIGPIVAFVQGVIDWFKFLWDELVGHSIVPDTIDAIVEWFLSLPGKILGAVEQFAQDVVSKFEGMWEDIKTWWNTNVAPKFTKSYWMDKFDSIRSGIAKKLAEVKKEASAKWEEIVEWFNTNTAPKFTKEYWTETFAGLKEGLIEAVRGGVNGSIEKINSFISWLNSNLKISLPAIAVGGKKVFGGSSFQVVTIPSIPMFKNGGVLEDGLFTMNHGEIAGKFTNGTSVVANNQMIVDGIAAGVYQAVVSAMRDANTGGSQNVSVYLDGKQIYASVKKTENERGRSLMGNQLGYSY